MALSFYVLVGYTKRERRSNEAGMKYFLLGAFSSGILLYGMSLLFGVAGSTNLGEIAPAVARAAASSADIDGLQPEAAGHPRDDRACRRALLQDRGRAVPHVGARRLSGRADARHGLPLHGVEGGELCAPRAHLPRSPRRDACGLGAPARDRGGRHHHGRQLGGGDTDERQAAARLLVDLERGLPPARRHRGQRVRLHRDSSSTSSSTPS